MFDFGYSANWLVEVTLVDGCAPFETGAGPSSDTAPLPDPCAWRHSWFYRVEPDDTVTLLFEGSVARALGQLDQVLGQLCRLARDVDLLGGEITERQRDNEENKRSAEIA